MYVWTPCVCSDFRDLKRAADPPELELQIVVNQQVLLTAEPFL